VVVRVLTDALHATPPGTEPDDALLARLYAPPTLPWLRVNMVTTADGAATGPGGVTGSINNAVDKRVFHLLRRTSDVVVVGSGTARAERYRSAPVPMVLVSRQGHVPALLRDAAPGAVLLATCADAPGLGDSRAVLGDDNVLVLGATSVDLVGLRHALVERGLRNLLCEGGPHLLADLVRAGVVDELCLTQVPHLVADDHPRIAVGDPVDRELDLAVLLEESGTLLGRWFLR
jgi:riboflavin biosynthesis pyrimidine reductase